MGVEGIDDEFRRIKAESGRQFGILMRAQKRDVGLFAWQQADQLTPVDEGEARRGWHFTNARPSDKDVQGTDQLGQLATVIEEGAPDDPFYLQNNVDHIDVLDQGKFVPPDPGPSKDPREGRTGRILVQGGFSVQAPKGIKGDLLDGITAKFGLQKTKDGF